MSVKRLSPRIVEDTDPPFAPVAVMRYDNDGLYVPVSEYAALLARHNALREAVEWERKAHSAYNDACAEDGYGQLVWATENLTKARAEVDRLLMEEK